MNAVAALYLFPQRLLCIPGKRRSSVLLRQHAAPTSRRTRPGRSQHRRITAPRSASPIPSPSPSRSLPQPTPASPLSGPGSQQRGLRTGRGEPSAVPGVGGEELHACGAARSFYATPRACESSSGCLPYIPAQRDLRTAPVPAQPLPVESHKAQQRRFNIPSPK